MRHDRLYLEDIVSACDAVELFIAGLSKNVFLENDLVLSAVTRKLEIIGEACSRLSPEMRDAHPEIDWRAIIGFRNILAHQYFSCDLDIVWEAASAKVGSLRASIKEMVLELEDR
ncbi:MAG TPA: DUF86 domain-containing protein [Pyrinomonadaceae bacterium]|nr:DUF86 domain-containing protein [Pyrinomonadaceae bacterium]